MTALPSQLAEIREDFHAVPDADKLTLLLEFSDELPDVPAKYADVEFEQVIECQSPVFITAEVEDGHVQLFAKAPPQAPTPPRP